MVGLSLRLLVQMKRSFWLILDSSTLQGLIISLCSLERNVDDPLNKERSLCALRGLLIGDARIGRRNRATFAFL